MPYFHKRTAKSAECLLDEPVPLRYYSTLPSGTVPRFHPRTMRELMILKSKEFIRDKDKKVEADDKDLVSFINDFKTELFKAFDSGMKAHEEKNSDWNMFMGEEDDYYFMGLNDDKTNFREVEANLTEDDEVVASQTQQDRMINPEPEPPTPETSAPAHNTRARRQIREEPTLRNDEFEDLAETDPYYSQH